MKLLLAVIATAIATTSVSANGWENMGNVYRDGVSIGSIYDVKMQEAGKNNKDAIAEVKQFYADLEVQRKKDRDQEKRAKGRAAVAEEVKRQEEIGEIVALLPEDVTPIVFDTVTAFLDTHPVEIQEKYGDILESVQTIDDVREFFNSAYGTDLSNSEIQELIEYGKTLSPEEEAAYIAGATTCAIKLLEGKGPCGAGTGTGA